MRNASCSSFMMLPKADTGGRIFNFLQSKGISSSAVHIIKEIDLIIAYIDLYRPWNSLNLNFFSGYNFLKVYVVIKTTIMAYYTLIFLLL